MVLLRAFAVWLILLLAESVHGVLRRLVLEPWIGDFSARQISVFTGAALILILSYVFIDWIRPWTARQLTLIGGMWVLLTLAFEVGVGKLLGYSWERIFSDFNLPRGGLLGIGLLVMGFAPRIAASLHRVKASTNEKFRTLAGDEWISHPIGSLTNAITIRCSRQDLWPWLVQMGAGRAGWYSYDSIDNGGRRSSETIVPELQDISIGTLFPALPRATDGFFVIDYKPEWFLVLGGGATTWAFVLEPVGPHHTRLITRARGNSKYDFHGLPLALVKLVHFIMERKQLLEIARRAEVRIVPAPLKLKTQAKTSLPVIPTEAAAFSGS
jgi:hypothetical protein